MSVFNLAREATGTDVFTFELSIPGWNGAVNMAKNIRRGDWNFIAGAVFKGDPKWANHFDPATIVMYKNRSHVSIIHRQQTWLFMNIKDYERDKIVLKFTRNILERVGLDPESPTDRRNLWRAIDEAIRAVNEHNDGWLKDIPHTFNHVSWDGVSEEEVTNVRIEAEGADGKMDKIVNVDLSNNTVKKGKFEPSNE